jgi:uncharacterized protein YqjF (DUF2071 family)
MAQVWHDLLFAHWPIPVDAMRDRVPSPLELDTFEGKAWLGIVPFRMSGVRLRWTPPLPRLSAFPELNVRTYAKLGNRPGVLFLSLDARNPLAVAIARAWFHLPYFRARMSCERESGPKSTRDGAHDDGARDDVRYTHERTHAGAPEAAFSASYGPRGGVFAARPGTLEQWLTERYCLYAAPREGNARVGRSGGSGAVWRAEIHHPPWPLQAASASFERNTMAAAHGFVLPETVPLLHFSRRQDVVVWNPERVA